MKELRHLSPVNTLLSGLICGVLALGTADLQAAKVPMSQKELELLRILSGRGDLER